MDLSAHSETKVKEWGHYEVGRKEDAEQLARAEV